MANDKNSVPIISIGTSAAEAERQGKAGQAALNAAMNPPARPTNYSAGEASTSPFATGRDKG